MIIVWSSVEGFALTNSLISVLNLGDVMCVVLKTGAGWKAIKVTYQEVSA